MKRPGLEIGAFVVVVVAADHLLGLFGPLTLAETDPRSTGLGDKVDARDFQDASNRQVVSRYLPRCRTVRRGEYGIKSPMITAVSGLRILPSSGFLGRTPVGIPAHCL